MGYFSNGTEGDWWAEKNCRGCVHEECCFVILAHDCYNYDQIKDRKLSDLLSMFIPRIGMENGKCTMFIKSKRSVDEIWKLKD